MVNVVSAHILYLITLHKTVWHREGHLLEFGAQKVMYRRYTQIELRFALVILVLTQLLIEDAEFLITEPRTTNAFATPLEIVAVDKVIGAVTILAVEAGMQLARIDALVASLAFTHDQGVHTITRVVRRAKVAVFAIDWSVNQIAVLAVSDIVTKITVLTVPDLQPELRHVTL